MRKKVFTILSLVLSLSVILAMTVPVVGYLAPGNSNTVDLNNSISRAIQTYHIGDTIYYSVKIYVSDPDIGTIPCYQRDINTYFTDPHDLVLPANSPQIHTIDFPLIPELLPGEYVIFSNGTVTSKIYDEANALNGGVTRAALTATAGAVAMPIPAYYYYSNTIYPGGTTILNSSYPKLDYVIDSADLVTNPDCIAFGYSWNTGGAPPVTSGAWDNPEYNDSNAKEMSISTYVSMPGTIVNIESSESMVVSGESVTLTVTEENTGNVSLSSPYVELRKNGALFATLNKAHASYVGGDTDGDGYLDGSDTTPETWTWVLDSGALTVAPTTFQATGHGMNGSLDVTWDEFPLERKSVTVEVESPGTVASIGSSTTLLPAEGGTIDLTITELNSGSIDLENVVMTVTNSVDATTYLLMKTGSTAPAVFVSGDTGNDGILGQGELWTWNIPGILVTSPVSFTVSGDATYGDPAVHVNFSNGYYDEVDSIGVNLSPPTDVPASGTAGIILLVAGLAGALALVVYRRTQRSHS